MKGIFNKMLVAALLMSVVPGVYAMGETMDSNNVNNNEVIENNDEVGISVDEAVSRFKLLDQKIGASSAVMYVADKARTLASDHKYVTGYLAADTLFRGKNSFVGSFAGSLCSVKGLVGLAAAYGVYKAAPIVSGYYSETLAPKVTTCYSGVSSFFGGISNRVRSAYESFKKPVVEEDTAIEMVSIHDENSDDEIVEISVTPVATPRQRSRSVSPAPTKPLPTALAGVVEKKNNSVKNPMPTKVAPTRPVVRTQPSVRTESTVIIHQDDVKPSVDAVVLEKNKSVVAEMAKRFNNKK